MDVISLLESDNEVTVAVSAQTPKSQKRLTASETKAKRSKKNTNNKESHSVARFLIGGTPRSPTNCEAIVEGEPTPQPRPRFLAGPLKKLYDPAKKQKDVFRNQVRDMLQLGDMPVFRRGLPLFAEFQFEMPRPANHFRSDGMVKPGMPKYCMTSPDIDNLCKYILDTMKGVIFQDDAQVVSLQAKMPYCLTPGDRGRTVVKILIEH